MLAFLIKQWQSHYGIEIIMTSALISGTGNVFNIPNTSTLVRLKGTERLFINQWIWSNCNGNPKRKSK